MKRVLYFGASSSKSSINQQLAEYTAKQLKGIEIKQLRLIDYEMPIYSIDREELDGIHPLALDFKKEISLCDALVISFAEHNGTYSAAYKNVYDWISRIEKLAYQNKPLLLLATSPGKRGGSSVLEQALNFFNRVHSSPVLHFSLPSFYENYSTQNGISEAFSLEYSAIIQEFQTIINEKKETDSSISF